VTLPAYLPILFLVILSTLFAVASIAVASKLSPRRWTAAKLEPYECGIVPERDPRGERFPVKFYLIAMLFIIFDVEAVFLYPWAVVLRDLGWYGLAVMGIFVGLLFESYYYVLRKGGLQWE
jgi:NADH-quinone oxidoreductase subunit A